MSDTFSSDTKEKLMRRAGGLCSFEGCGKITIGPSKNTSSKSVTIGEAAHIAAASKGGPRYDPNMTPEQRSDISNGIWLCADHATLIDKNDGADYPVSVLKDMKQKHEKKVSDALVNGKSLFLQAILSYRMNFNAIKIMNGHHITETLLAHSVLLNCGFNDEEVECLEEPFKNMLMTWFKISNDTKKVIKKVIEYGDFDRDNERVSIEADLAFDKAKFESDIPRRRVARSIDNIDNISIDFEADTKPPTITISGDFALVFIHFESKYPNINWESLFDLFESYDD